MKKSIYLILLFIAQLSTSCSKDENNTNFINPPDWIIGTWMDISNESGGFRFTSDNIYDLNPNGDVFMNLKEGLQEYVNTGKYIVDEYITDTNYTFKVTLSGTTAIEYEFIKNDGNTIIYVTSDFTDRYNIILTKE